VRNSERPIAIDLFGGAGGLSHGLEAAGYRVALSVDTEDWALKTHAHNFQGIALQRDLALEESRAEIAARLEGIEVSLIASGPPCQPFSRAGRSKIRSLVDRGTREAVDHRKELWRGFLDVVERIRPWAVLMENVPDMALGDGTFVLRLMMDRLERTGYEVDARIVDTWLHGVPQHRQRLILVGVRGGGAFHWPLAQGQVTVRDAIGDLPVLAVTPDTTVGAEVLDYGNPEMSDFARKARKRCVGDEAGRVYDHLTRAVRHDDYEAFTLMNANTLYSDLPARVKRYRDDIFDDKYNRLDWSSYSRSITAHIAKDGYWYIHPDQPRTLTVREAARLQTFPDTFRFAGSRSHQFQQIGNAVPPVLAEVIGSALLACLRNEERPRRRLSKDRAQFRERLGRWAAKDSQLSPWAYPGDPWPVTVGLIVGSKRSDDWVVCSDVLGCAPTLEDATSTTFAAIKRLTGPGRQRDAVKRIEKVAAAVRRRAAGWESDGWHRTARFGPTALRWYSLMAGDSTGLVTSAAVLRVTARVSGTTADRRNQNSTGRMELAKLVGAGEDAATLNVAMHRLGQSVCTPRNPACQSCPLQESCASATG
jgi:DNA (cytosine-5)-methyltransferase 1